MSKVNIKAIQGKLARLLCEDVKYVYIGFTDKNDKLLNMIDNKYFKSYSIEKILTENGIERGFTEMDKQETLDAISKMYVYVKDSEINELCKELIFDKHDSSIGKLILDKDGTKYRILYHYDRAYNKYCIGYDNKVDLQIYNSLIDAINAVDNNRDIPNGEEYNVYIFNEENRSITFLETRMKLVKPIYRISYPADNTDIDSVDINKSFKFDSEEAAGDFIDKQYHINKNIYEIFKEDTNGLEIVSTVCADKLYKGNTLKSLNGIDSVYAALYDSKTRTYIPYDNDKKNPKELLRDYPIEHVETLLNDISIASLLYGHDQIHIFLGTKEAPFINFYEAVDDNFLTSDRDTISKIQVLGNRLNINNILGKKM